MASFTERVAFIEHVTCEVEGSFDRVRECFEAAAPRIDPVEAFRSAQRDFDQAMQELANQPPLAIFSSYDRSAVLAVAGQARRCIQYEMGSPLATLWMVRRHLPALLYAPFRVQLLESREGRVTFEYDKPSSVLRHFQNRVTREIARELDAALAGVLRKVSFATRNPKPVVGLSSERQ